jgi:hypothetical protein
MSLIALGRRGITLWLTVSLSFLLKVLLNTCTGDSDGRREVQTEYRFGSSFGVVYLTVPQSMVASRSAFV